MKRATVALILPCVLLAGCANTLHMTYTCDPSGAQLHEVGTNANWGACPTTVNYDITKDDKAKGYMTLKGMTATWVSGATASTPTIHSDLSLGTNQQFHFDRPRDVPGYDVDANYALNLQRNAILAAQAQEAAYANYLSAVQASKPAPAPVYSGPTSCTTMPIGNMLQTNCH